MTVTQSTSWAAGAALRQRTGVTKSVLRGLVPALVAVALFKLALSDGGRHGPTLSWVQAGGYLALVLLAVLRQARRLPLSRPLLVIVAVTAAGLLWSIRPESTLRELLLWVTYAAIFVVTGSTLSGPSAVGRFLDAVVSIGGWLALTGLYLFWGADNPSMRWYSTFYYANAFAGFLLLMLPLVLTRLVHASRTREALVFTALGVLLGGAFVLTYSRGAWVILGAVTPLMLLLWRPRSWGRAIAGVGAVVLVSVLGVVVLTRAPQEILGRATTIADVEGYSLQGRLNFWRAGYDVFRAHPLLGTGSGTFAYAAARYQRDIRFYARNPHSLYVQTVAENGVIGGLALAALLVASAALGLRVLRRLRGTPEYPLAAGAGAGMTAFFLHSAIEMNWAFPAGPAAAFGMLGALAALDVRQGGGERPSVRRSRLWPAAAALILAAGAAVPLLLDYSDRHLRSGRAAFRRGDLPAAEEEFRAALRLNPFDPNAHSALGDVLWVTSGPQDETLHHAARAMTLDRMNAYYSLQLASYYLRGTPTTQTAKANAEGLLRHALDLDRFHYPRAYAMLAQLHVEAGRPDAAEEVFREAARTYGDLAVLVHNDILEARLWPAVAVLYVRRGELLITQGRTADAEDVLRSVIRVDGSQSLAYLRLADALRRAGRRAAAAAVLSEGLAKNPSSDVLWVAWRTFGGPRTAVYER